jgi:hypothetical protein
LKHGSDLLGLAVVGEEVEEVFEISDCHFEPFFGGGEGGGVEAIAFRLVGGGEVVEGEVEGWIIFGQSKIMSPVLNFLEKFS